MRARTHTHACVDVPLCMPVCVFVCARAVCVCVCARSWTCPCYCHPCHPMPTTAPLYLRLPQFALSHRCVAAAYECHDAQVLALEGVTHTSSHHQVLACYLKGRGGEGRCWHATWWGGEGVAGVLSHIPIYDPKAGQARQAVAGRQYHAGSGQTGSSRYGRGGGRMSHIAAQHTHTVGGGPPLVVLLAILAPSRWFFCCRHCWHAPPPYLWLGWRGCDQVLPAPPVPVAWMEWL